MVSVNAVPKREVFSCRHRSQPQIVGPFFGQGQADQSAAELRHEVDGFGRDELGGQGQIAFVLTIFVVHNNDHASGTNLRDRFGDIDELNLSWRASTLPDCILLSRNDTERKKKSAASTGGAFDNALRELQGRLDLKSPGLEQRLGNVLRVLVPSWPTREVASTGCTGPESA